MRQPASPCVGPVRRWADAADEQHSAWQGTRQQYCSPSRILESAQQRTSTPPEGSHTQGPAPARRRRERLLARLRRARRAGHRPLTALHLQLCNALRPPSMTRDRARHSMKYRKNVCRTAAKQCSICINALTVWRHHSLHQTDITTKYSCNTQGLSVCKLRAFRRTCCREVRRS